jgi:hypothetical protein
MWLLLAIKLERTPGPITSHPTGILSISNAIKRLKREFDKSPQYSV